MKTKMCSFFIFVLLGVSVFAQTPVNNATDLYNIRNNLSGNYIQMASIDLSSYVDWTPIGDDGHPFTGTFDGNGHVISGLAITPSSTIRDYVGLFGYVSGATLKNTHVEKGAIHGTVCDDNTTPGWHYVGLLVGYAGGSSIFNNIVDGEVCGTAAVGGMAGGIYSGTDFHHNQAAVIVSASNGNVDDPNPDYAEEVGGLVGQSGGRNDYTSGIYSSFATGDVTAREANVVGGLVGEANGETYQNYATGNVIGRGYVGGLAGSSYTIIHDSYATGGVTALADISADPLRAVAGTGAVGGIVGGSRRGAAGVGNGVNHTYSRFDRILGYQAGGITGVTDNQTPSVISCNAALGTQINGYDTQGEEGDRIYRIYDTDSTDTTVSVPNWANRTMGLMSLDDGTIVTGAGAGIDADVSNDDAIITLFTSTMAGMGCGFDFVNIWNAPNPYPTLRSVGAVLPISTPEQPLPDDPDFGFGE